MRVAGIGLVLTADGPLTGAIHGKAGHVDEVEAGLGQHRFGKAGDAADDIEPDPNIAAEGAKLVNGPRDVSGPVRELAIDMDQPILVNSRDPVNIFGDVDSNIDPHGAHWRSKFRLPARAVIALHSDQSQSLISGRGGLAVPGDMPPEPFRAASMKTIPAPPPLRDTGMPASRSQALFSQHLKGRAA